MPSSGNQGQVPEEVQRYRWEADQLSYEPPESAPTEHSASLLAPLGEYISVEDLPALRQQFAEELAGEFERLADETGQPTQFEAGFSHGYAAAATLTRKWATDDRGRP
jgi:hypothetical protein